MNSRQRRKLAAQAHNKRFEESKNRPLKPEPEGDIDLPTKPAIRISRGEHKALMAVSILGAIG